MAINRLKKIASVTYNGVEIPLKSAGGINTCDIDH